MEQVEITFLIAVSYFDVCSHLVLKQFGKIVHLKKSCQWLYFGSVEWCPVLNNILNWLSVFCIVDLFL